MSFDEYHNLISYIVNQVLIIRTYILPSTRRPLFFPIEIEWVGTRTSGFKLNIMKTKNLSETKKIIAFNLIVHYSLQRNYEKLKYAKVPENEIAMNIQLSITLSL